MTEPDRLSRWRRPTIETGCRLAAAGLAVVGAVEFSRSRAYEFQLERIGGKFAVMSAQLGAWFDGLWSGRPLATTLAVLTVVGVVLLLLIGRLASSGPDRHG